MTPRHRERTEVVVVGLGAMGSATCLALARRGVPVIGIDRWAPPHRFGSTHGDTRITRVAVGEGPDYVPLVRRSHELWRELEAQSGAAVLTQGGGVMLGRPGSPFLARTLEMAQRFGIAHERLTNDDLRRRFPMFGVDEATEGYFEPSAGYLRPETAVAAQLELARRRGARLRVGEQVRAWAAAGDGVTVTTDAGSYAAARLVLCVGPWIPQLVPQLAGRFAVHRQLLHWFPIRRDHDRLREMPVFVWDFGGDAGPFVHLRGFYGFPALDGPNGGVKVATETYERTTVPDGRQHPATAAETAAMYSDYVQGRLPWLGREAVRSVSCLYTCTRGSRFVIDRHPDHENVLVVSPCSGHGFKHSPAIGEAAAQWVTGEPGLDLTPFRLAAAVSDGQRRADAGSSSRGTETPRPSTQASNSSAGSGGVKT